MPLLTALCLIVGLTTPVAACLWDSDTLIEERITNPKLASAIFDEPPKPDVRRLRDRIAKLEAARSEDDPAWWNDLAGAHIRLGEPQRAVELLEPLLTRFPKDYGIHANLGTAYHLLGRYQDAEREIARDLEINPNAHFGLEKYHLALLQYLMRDAKYQARHVYVDEWTRSFLTSTGAGLSGPGTRLSRSATTTFVPYPTSNSEKPETREQQLAQTRKEVAAATDAEGREHYGQTLLWLEAAEDRPVPYRYRWDLAKDPKFAEGVMYMASLNREQPSAWVMLGIAAVANEDLNLGKAAYQKAIALGSPQSNLLQTHVDEIDDHISRAGMDPDDLLKWLIAAAVGVFIVSPLGLWYLIRGRHKMRRLRVARRPTLPLEGS